MVSKAFLLLLCALAVDKSIGLQVETKDCGSPPGQFSSVDVDCNEGSKPSRCHFSVGKTYTALVKVTPVAAVNQSTIVVHAMVAGMSERIPIPDPDLCEGHGVVCPLKPNQEVTVSLSVTIPKRAPHFNIEIKVELMSNKKDFVCFSYYAKLD